MVAKHVLLILRNGPFLNPYPKLLELKFCWDGTHHCPRLVKNLSPRMFALLCSRGLIENSIPSLINQARVKSHRWSSSYHDACYMTRKGEIQGFPSHNSKVPHIISSHSSTSPSPKNRQWRTLTNSPESANRKVRYSMTILLFCSTEHCCFSNSQCSIHWTHSVGHLQIDSPCA